MAVANFEGVSTLSSGMGSLRCGQTHVWLSLMRVTLMKGEPVPIRGSGSGSGDYDRWGWQRHRVSDEGGECLEMLAFIYSFTCFARPAKALYHASVQW